MGGDNGNILSFSSHKKSLLEAKLPDGPHRLFMMKMSESRVIIACRAMSGEMLLAALNRGDDFVAHLHDATVMSSSSRDIHDEKLEPYEFKNGDMVLCTDQTLNLVFHSGEKVDVVWSGSPVQLVSGALQLARALLVGDKMPSGDLVIHPDDPFV